jgi:RNA polymerase sigma factor (TIGR02999 family)
MNGPTDIRLRSLPSAVTLKGMSDVSQLLNALEQGDPHAANQLLPLVYNELRRLAAHKLGREAPGQTLQPTALVHEAYLRLVGKGAEQHWDGRRHFFAAAAEAMRRILVENARRKKAPKHGGDRQRVDLEEYELAIRETPDEVLALDEALTKLAQEDPPAAELVKLHFFAGLSIEEAATAMGVSRATAYRHWTYGRAWLRSALRSSMGEPPR